MAKIPREFWTGRTTHEEMKILASGTEVFLQVLLALNHMIQMASGGSDDDLMLTYNVEAVKKAISDRAQALHDSDRSDNPKVDYWTKEEVKEFCSHVVALDTSTYAYLENVGTQAFSVEKVVQFAEKQKIPGNLLNDTLKVTTVCFQA